MIAKKTRTDIKSNVQQNMEQLKDSHNGGNNKQQTNNNRTATLERTAA